MVEWCQPCSCKFLDGLLAVFFTCSMVGASVLICTIYLDQQMNGGHCIVMNLNSSITQIDVPEQFNKIVCQSVKIIAMVQIVVPIFLILFSWVIGFNAYLAWWILEAIVTCILAIVALIVGVIFTTTLLIFCGQLYWATEEPSCLYGAMKYDKMFFPKHGAFSDKTQLAFDHVVAVVAASWFVFFSFFFAALVILVRACTKFYHKKEENMYRMQMAAMLQNARNAQHQQQQQVRQHYDLDEQHQFADDTPLIQI